MPTDAEIQGWLAQNPNASPTDIYNAMNQYGVTEAQLSSATGRSMDELNKIGMDAGLTNYQIQNAGKPGMAPIQPGQKPTDAQVQQMWNNNISTANGSQIANQMQQYGLSTTDMLRSLGTAGMGDAMNRMWQSGNVSTPMLAAYQQQHMGGNDPSFSGQVNTPWQSYGMQGGGQPQQTVRGADPRLYNQAGQQQNTGGMMYPGGNQGFNFSGGSPSGMSGVGNMYGGNGYSLTGQNPGYQQSQLGFGYSQPRYGQQNTAQMYGQPRMQPGQFQNQGGGMNYGGMPGYSLTGGQQYGQQRINRPNNMGFGQNTANATTSQFSGLNGRGLL